MVPQQTHVEFAATVNALKRVRPITNHVAQTVDTLNFLSANISQHCVERFEVTVNVADDCEL